MYDSESIDVFKSSRVYDLDKLKCSYNKSPKGLERIITDGGALRVFLSIMSLEELSREDSRWTSTAVCCVSDELIADYLGMHVNTVRRHLNTLSDLGLVRVEKRNGQRFNTKYYDFRGMAIIQTEVDELLLKAGLKKRFRREKEESIEPLEGNTGTVCGAYNTSNEHQNGCPKGHTGTIRGAYNNNYKETKYKKTSIGDEPREDNIEDESKGGEIPSYKSRQSTSDKSTTSQNVAAIGDELDSVTAALGVLEKHRTVLSDNQLRKLKGVDRLTQGGDAKAIDIVNYFSTKYLEIYGTPYSISNDKKPERLAILRTGFMEKYPRPMWVQLIDLLLQTYETCPGIPRDKYPRPSISCLTQTWLMELLIHESKKQILIAQETESRLKGQELKKQVPVDKAPFNMNLLYRFDDLGPEGQKLVDLFNDKYDKGLLNDKTWLTDMTVPIDIIKEDLLNA